MSESVSMMPQPREGLIRRISLRFGERRAKEVERFLKFAVVGVIGTLINLILTNLLEQFVFHPKPDDSVPVLIATAIGFCTAVISNFLFNRYWTYPESQSRPIAPQLAQFFIVNIFGLGISLLVVRVLDIPIAGVISQIVGSKITLDIRLRLAANVALLASVAIVMQWNFFVNRYWTYRHVK